MADLATVFHWPPSEMEDWGLAELCEWRERARVRNEPQKPRK